MERHFTMVLWGFRRAARSPRALALLFGVFGLVLPTVVGIATGMPEPAVHDEFAYLLSAETFAAGRLTNPTHPLWRHFETFHVIHEPSYSAKYPPGQGLVLAVGLLLTGHPASGLWLSLGVFSAVLIWMLLKWVPGHWAVGAGLLAVTQLVWTSYWGDSYWGGAVAATGGGLASGALRAWWSEPRIRYGVGLGVGFVVMAFSRPFEGALLAIAIVAAAAWAVHVADPGRRQSLVATLSPAVMITLLGLGGLGVHNRSVTGSWTTFPYQAHEEQYAAAPTFLWEVPRSRSYNHPEMERYWIEQDLGLHRRLRQPVGFASLTALKLAFLSVFILGPGLLVLAYPGPGRGRWQMFSGLAVLGVVAGSLLTKVSAPHYIAPVVPLLYVLVAMGLRRAHRLARKRAVRWDFAVVAAGALVAFLPFRTMLFEHPSLDRFARARADIEHDLAVKDGRDLIIVTYQEPTTEWVYNGAELDDAEVVWARSMGACPDEQLMAYYADRWIWELAVGEENTLRLLRGPIPR